MTHDLLIQTDISAPLVSSDWKPKLSVHTPVSGFTRSFSAYEVFGPDVLYRTNIRDYTGLSDLTT